MGTGSDKKGQNKKQIRERDCENYKVRRQTSECKATLVWTREKERRRLRWKKMIEMAVPSRRGRQRLKFMDQLKDVLGGSTEEILRAVNDRDGWRNQCREAVEG